MSGQQIGTVVGGIIGAYFGAPQLGAAIGGMIGGAVDPTKVYGPRLGDAQKQTAMDGAFRSYGYGTYPTAGCIIWVDPTVKEHKHTDDGKGSGQEQITYTYSVSSAIGIGKGLISGIKLVTENNKVVFDARTDAELAELGYSSQQIAETRAAQAKFLKRAKFYYGTADQLPDPTMVAVKGVGNVPAYAGTAYMVLTDAPTIEGEVAQYGFVVANCGDRTEDDSGVTFGHLVVTGNAAEVGSALAAFARPADAPEFIGFEAEHGADLSQAVVGASPTTWAMAMDSGTRYTADALTDVTEWDAGNLSSVESIEFFLSGGGEWAAKTAGETGGSGTGGALFAGSPANLVEVNPSALSTIGGPVSLGRQMLARIDGYWYTSGVRSLYRAETMDGPFQAVWDGNSNIAMGWNNNGACIMGFYDAVSVDDRLYCIVEWHFDTTFQRFRIWWSPDGGQSMSEANIEYDQARSDNASAPVQIVNAGGVVVALCENYDVVTNAGGTFVRLPTGLTASVNKWSARKIATDGNRVYVVASNQMVVSLDGGATWSAPIELPIASAKSIAYSANADTWAALPDAPGYYVNPYTGEIVGPDGTQISVCEPTLGTVVSRQCAKRISTGVIDVSELTDLVTGFRVAAPSSPQKNIGALMPGYFFDSSEFDGVLHFPKRGGEDSFALTVDDLCQRDGDLIEWERTQESELLRKLTVAYLDPDTTYTATTQQWERRSGTVKAEGEGTIELPIVGSKDWAARVAHKSGKVAWAEPDKCKFSTSIAQAALVPAAVGTITDEAGTVHRVRIERIEDEGLLRMVEARRTRADVYESTVSGVSKPLPLFPGSDIRGPTDGLLLNLPVIVDTNDVPGIAWAAAGFLSGWRGGTLQFLRAGQWVDAGTVTLPATMGTLLDALPAHAGDIDYVNTLSVRMNDALESVTFTNLLQERNPLAILYPDGTAEIVQPQTVTEVAANEFECTTLIRGRLNTVRGDHASGARVVFLDSFVKYATLQPTDLGTTLTYRFVSLGTDPDAAVTQTLDLTTMQSQTEWPVADLQVEQDGDDYTLTWLARDRLGTDVFPIRSTNWRGYEVSWSYGGDTHTETVLTETATFNLPGASDVTFSVAQLNLFTGAGPAQTVMIP